MQYKKILGLTFSAILIIILITIVVKNQLENSSKFNSIINEEDGTKKISYELKFNNLDGQYTNLSDYKGKILILNFWTTWCPPCIKEAPQLNQFYKSKGKNVELLAINLTSKESKGLDAVKDFQETYDLKFPIFIDKDSTLENKFQILTIPTTYIIDPQGTILYNIEGPLNKKDLEEIIEKIN